MPDMDLPFQKLTEQVDFLIRNKRCEPRKADLDALALVIALYYVGLCPCCHRRRIVDEAGNPMPAQWTVDHWNNPSRTDPIDIWPVCRNCNQKLYSKRGYKTKRHSMFIVFQILRMEQESQLRLDFSYKA
jgi:hypothetical protein